MAITKNLSARAQELDKHQYNTTFRLIAHPSNRLEVAKINVRKLPGEQPNAYLETHPNKQYNQTPLHPEQLHIKADESHVDAKTLEQHINDTLTRQEKHLHAWNQEVDALLREETLDTYKISDLAETLTERLIAYTILFSESNQQLNTDAHAELTSSRAQKSLTGMLDTQEAINKLTRPKLTYNHPQVLHTPNKYVRLASRAS